MTLLRKEKKCFDTEAIRTRKEKALERLSDLRAASFMLKNAPHLFGLQAEEAFRAAASTVSFGELGGAYRNPKPLGGGMPLDVLLEHIHPELRELHKNLQGFVAELEAGLKVDEKKHDLPCLIDAELKGWRRFGGAYLTSPFGNIRFSSITATGLAGDIDEALIAMAGDRLNSDEMSRANEFISRELRLLDNSLENIETILQREVPGLLARMDWWISKFESYMPDNPSKNLRNAVASMMGEISSSAASQGPGRSRTS